VKVRASGVPVLALEETPETADPQVAAEVAAALAEDRPGAVVLGCAGMARLAEPFTARFGVPVIDGVRAVSDLLALHWPQQEGQSDEDELPNRPALLD